MTKLSKKDLIEIHQWRQRDRDALLKIGDGEGRPVKIDDLNIRLNLSRFITIWHKIGEDSYAEFYCTLNKKGEAAYHLFVEK